LAQIKKLVENGWGDMMQLVLLLPLAVGICHDDDDDDILFSTH